MGTEGEVRPERQRWAVVVDHLGHVFLAVVFPSEEIVGPVELPPDAKPLGEGVRRWEHRRDGEVVNAYAARQLVVVDDEREARLTRGRLQDVLEVMGQ